MVSRRCFVLLPHHHHHPIRLEAHGSGTLAGCAMECRDVVYSDTVVTLESALYHKRARKNGSSGKHSGRCLGTSQETCSPVVAHCLAVDLVVCWAFDAIGGHSAYLTGRNGSTREDIIKAMVVAPPYHCVVSRWTGESISAQSSSVRVSMSCKQLTGPAVGSPLVAATTGPRPRRKESLALGSNRTATRTSIGDPWSASHRT